METEELYLKLVAFINDNGLIINTEGDDLLSLACREICHCDENAN